MSCTTVASLVMFFELATPALSALSLHDALPISMIPIRDVQVGPADTRVPHGDQDFTGAGRGFRHRFHGQTGRALDRKNTRLNSSHLGISYAVFCFKKKIRVDPLIQSTDHARVSV